MALVEHLRELRNRFLVCVAAVLVAAVVGWVEYQTVYDYLKQPLAELSHQGGWGLVGLNLPGLTTPFALQLKVSLWVGVILASPVWLYEIWAFIVPGLTTREKRTAAAFIAAAVPLFLSGCALAGYLLPKAIHVLIGFTPSGTSNLIPADEYIAFATRFILAFGLSFLVPVFLVALNVAGVLSAELMLKGWRIAVVGCFVFAAFMTPTPDAWTMFALALPLCALYFGAWGIAWLNDRRRAKDRPDWADLPDDAASPL